jgi:hypothetical protein
MDLTDKDALIDRLLKEKSGDADQTEMNDNPEDMLNNLSPEQLEMLTKMYNNDPKIKEEIKNNSKTFLPEPGFCLKAKTSKNEKVFLNICKSIEINAPKDISDEELIELIDRQNMENSAFHFRVPMSLGEPHTELDNAAEACTAYDICINPAFLKKVLEKTTFMGFFISIVIEGLEEKYKIKLDRNCKMLNRKKFMGKISEQSIRVKSKPLIAEMSESEKQKNEQTSKIEEIKRITPRYKIIREPAEGVVEFLVAEIELPKIISAKSLTLDIGEDRILLNTRSGIYFLDIYLPFSFNQEECGSQFDKQTKILSITIPVIAN